MEELKKSAAKHFAANPGHDVYHVTKDGQCFVKWHDANEHSKSIKQRDIAVIKRGDVSVSASPATGGSSDGKELTLIEKINACTTEAEVNALIKNNSPKAAKEAAKAKISSLVD